jgi:hypothetical protein
MKRLSDDFSSLGLAGQLLRVSQIGHALPPEVVEAWGERYRLKQERKRRAEGGEEAPAADRPAGAETSAPGPDRSPEGPSPDWLVEGSHDVALIVSVDEMPARPPKRTPTKGRAARTHKRSKYASHH